MDPMFESWVKGGTVIYVLENPDPSGKDNTMDDILDMYLPETFKEFQQWCDINSIKIDDDETANSIVDDKTTKKNMLTIETQMPNTSKSGLSNTSKNLSG
jgi:hypothetical protein